MLKTDRECEDNDDDLPLASHRHEWPIPAIVASSAISSTADGETPTTSAAPLPPSLLKERAPIPRVKHALIKASIFECLTIN